MPQSPEDSGREDQIKQRAHRIWQDEGEPHGRHDDHWRQAESELGMENGGELDDRSIMADETGGSAFDGSDAGSSAGSMGIASSIPAAGAAADAALGEITKSEITKSRRTTKTRATKA